LFYGILRYINVKAFIPPVKISVFKADFPITLTSKRAVIGQKQISVEGDGHCCPRPSSNCETNLVSDWLLQFTSNTCRSS